MKKRVKTKFESFLMTQLNQSYLSMFEKSVKNFEQFVIDEKTKQMERLIAKRQYYVDKTTTKRKPQTVDVCGFCMRNNSQETLGKKEMLEFSS